MNARNGRWCLFLVFFLLGLLTFPTLAFLALNCVTWLHLQVEFQNEWWTGKTDHYVCVSWNDEFGGFHGGCKEW